MTTGHQALTDKEKQTLRLLLAGHDAKSIARYLGLSVHTVNERLRDARRKLGASSSREAARALHNAEGVPPELLADRLLGDAGPAAALPSVPPSASAFPRRTVWLIGGLAVMTFAVALLALSTTLQITQTSATTPGVSQESAVTQESTGAQAARQWLALVDAGNWPDSWAATGVSFRAVNTVANWEGASQTARVPLGAVRSRVLDSDVLAPTPPAGNRVVRFKTAFANKADATETVALVFEDGAWKVVGYFID